VIHFSHVYTFEHKSNAMSTCGLLSVTKPIITVSKGSGTYELACSSIESKMISKKTVAGEANTGRGDEGFKQRRRLLQDEPKVQLPVGLSSKTLRDASRSMKDKVIPVSFVSSSSTGGPSTPNSRSNVTNIMRLNDLNRGCSEICNTAIQGRKSLFYPEIIKNVNCPALMSNHHIDASRPIGPAPEIPPEMMPAFTYHGVVPVVPHSVAGYKGKLFNQQYMGGEALSSVWKKTLVDFWKTQCSKNNLWGNYGKTDTNNVFVALNSMKSVTRGGHLLVIGSENPWLESCALAAGAKHVTTLG